MRGYAPACRDEIFAGAREQFAETEEWLAGEAAGCSTLSWKNNWRCGGES